LHMQIPGRFESEYGCERLPCQCRSFTLGEERVGMYQAAVRKYQFNLCAILLDRRSLIHVAETVAYRQTRFHTPRISKVPAVILDRTLLLSQRADRLNGEVGPSARIDDLS